MTAVLGAARAWRDDDPDPSTREELDALITAAESGAAVAADELSDRFSGRLEFGTAGLRGALGAGPNRMNRAVVIRTAAGLTTYLQTVRTPVDGSRHRVVIGYDARYGS